ncbi:hypothetical protein J4207_05510, partial [Candidatus Woesearchaeota archaeon]|nr:hypothetical protein [Candidatus Woesearchaeota archaeon]
IQRSKTSPLKGFSEHYKKVTWIFKPVNQLNKYGNQLDLNISSIIKLKFNRYVGDACVCWR